MKTQPIRLIEKQGLTFVKDNKSKVFRPQELSTEFFNKLNPEMDRLEYAAQKVKKPIYFYPLSEERSLMNFGTYTYVINNDLPQKELSELLSKCVQKTYNACNISK